MTTSKRSVFGRDEAGEYYVFPDPPENPEDKMTSFDQLAATGNAHHLAIYLGNPETTLVAGERYLVVSPTRSLAGARYPDLMVAFDVDPTEYHRRKAYVISDQRKPPDFVLEIASPSTGRVDVTDKRVDYARFEIAEYWRFDETGEYHGTGLAGDRLVHGQYIPIPIEEMPDGNLQGHSGVLNLDLRWDQGRLGWYDPATGRHIPTFDDERARADRAEAELIAAAARIAELEERLRSQDI